MILVNMKPYSYKISNKLLTAKELTICVIPESRLSAKFKCVNLWPMCCVRNIREFKQTPLLPLLC